MSLKQKLKEFINPVEEEEYLEMDGKASTSMDYEQPMNKSISKLPADTKMVLFEPRSFDEAQEVGMHLKGGRAAVINLHRLPKEYSQRTIDFITGVIFALDGTIQKIGHNVVLCTPKNMGVAGAIRLNESE
ncbi:MAG: cell division protein SepF [Erysipelotrichaceae bacterium]|nr:cell division protein SepF [Erysipelotrichaceae bacterium]MCD8574407.1 cell division protein SepF [Erysipelotrichaceae bacterium]